MSETPQTAVERDELVAKEYGKYVAVQAIDIGTARAFNVGDQVPTSTVERSDADGGCPFPKEYVAKTTTKAAEAAVADATPKG